MRMRAKGFTLIELMVVVVVTAVLACIAYPSYRHVVMKSRRTEAKAALTTLMQQQERYYAQHSTYLAFSSSSVDADARRFKWYSGESPKNSSYEIIGEACGDDSLRNCIRIIARPGTAMVGSTFSDEVCGELSLTSAGIRKASGNAEECWK